METERISCRIDSHKLDRLRKECPGSTTTSIIERLIDYSLSGDSRKPIVTKLSDSGVVQLSDRDREGIRLLRNAYQRDWMRRNPDKVKAAKERAKPKRDKVKAEVSRQKYWLKKLKETNE